MTSRWPRWTPSNVPTATRRGRGCASGRWVTFMRTRKPTIGLSTRALPRLGDGDRPVVVDEQRRAVGRGRRRRPPRGRAAGVVAALQAHDRQDARRARRRAAAGRSGSASVDVERRRSRVRRSSSQYASPKKKNERPDRRAPQLLAVRVAEVGDERAHVRAREHSTRSATRSPSRHSSSNAWTSTCARASRPPRPRARACTRAARRS